MDRAVEAAVDATAAATPSSAPSAAVVERQRARAEEREARRRRRDPWLRASRAVVRFLPLPVAAVLGQAFGLADY